MSKRLLLLLGCALILATACGEVGSDEPSTTLIAQFNPAPVSPDADHLISPMVPAPSDLLIDPATGMVNLPLEYSLAVLGQKEPVVIPAFSTDAVTEFMETYFNTLHGFVTAITTSFVIQGAALDAATVNEDTVRVYDVTGLVQDDVETYPVVRVDGYSIAQSLREEGSPYTDVVIAPPAAGWEQGHTYMMVVTSGVKDEAGVSLSSGYVFNFLKGTDAVYKDGGSVTALPDETALQLEELRLQLAPLFGWLEGVAEGDMAVPRKDIALLWTLTIHSEPIALNDPSAGVVPTPNDLLKTSVAGSRHDCDGDGKADCIAGNMCFPIDCENDSGVQKRLMAHMNSLDGWPVSSLVITSGFSRPLDSEAVTADSVFVSQLTEEGPVPLENLSFGISEDGMTLNIAPGQPMVPGGKYSVVLTRGLKGAEGGLSVAPSQVTAISKLTEAVAGNGGVSYLAELGVDMFTGLLLEVVRQGANSLIQLLDLDGSRENIASIWSFSVQSDNEAIFDVTSGDIPFPNDLMMALDEAGNPVSINLPIDPTWPAAQQQIVGAINQLDGFSPVGALSASFSRPLDESSFKWLTSISTPDLETIYFNDNTEPGLGDISVAVVDVTEVDPSAGIMGLAPLLDPTNIYGPDSVDAHFVGGKLVLQPKTGAPLLDGRRYMAILFDNLTSAENDASGEIAQVKVAPTFFLARESEPLVDEEGHSQVIILSDADAAQLEQLRSNYNPIFTALEGIGVPRERLVMFWTFTTQNVVEWLAGLNTELAGKGTPNGVTGTVGDGTAMDSLTGLGTVVTDGRLSAWTGLSQPDLTNPEAPDFGSMMQDEAGNIEWAETEIPFLLLVPQETAEHVAPFPVIMYQHGFFGSKEKALMHAQSYLDAGYALLAIDLPLHGERTPAGVEGGTGFLSADAAGSKDHIVQASLDMAQTLRGLDDGGALQLWLTDELGSSPLDSGRVYLVGHSLGAMCSVIVAAVENALDAVVLIAPGGHLTRILSETESAWLKDPIMGQLSAMGIEPGTSAYNQFVTMAQILLDKGDPIHYARRMARSPLDGVSAKPVLIIQPGADGLMPEATSRGIACAMRTGDMPYVKRFEGQCHSFYEHGCSADDAPPGADATTALGDILTFLDGAGDGTAVVGAIPGTELECTDDLGVTR